MQEDKTTNHVYTHAFYEEQSGGSLRSAREVVPLVLQLMHVSSVVDIGCGIGTWLSVFRENGVQKYLGIDGDYVDLEMLMIEPEKFLAHNLSQKISIPRQFDLAISLEVAEHIAEGKSQNFVETVTALSPVILFSAAIPFQGGKGHLNEQWPDYWIEKFRQHGYIPIDCLRKKIWKNTKIQAWYRQNLFFFVKESALSNYPIFLENNQSDDFLYPGIVHPQIYLNSIALMKAKAAYADPLQVSRVISPLLDGECCQENIDNFRELRYQIARLYLSLSDELLPLIHVSDVGNSYRLLREKLGGEFCSDIVGREKQLVDEVLLKLNSSQMGACNTNDFLVAMLYKRADELEHLPTILEVPSWLLSEYIQYILYVPSIFTQNGQIERFYQHIRRCIDEIYDGISRQTESPFWIEVSGLFSKYLCCIPLYFTSYNLKDIYLKRSEIIEFHLSNCGYEINYSFELERPALKIRVGILLPMLGAYAQAFGTIPTFEYLNRNKFDITVYVSQLTESSVEDYCKSRVDRIVSLSGNLKTDAQIIREDDLDILIIGANVTAVVNQITLLSLHRLARSQFHLIRSPVTTGMRHADFYISGHLSEQHSTAEEHYQEELVKLDGTGLCFNYSLAEPKTLSSVVTRDSLNIPRNSIIFISGSNFYKVIPELRETWIKMLVNVKNSILILYPFAPSWSNTYPKEQFLKSMRHYLEMSQVAANRLIVLDALSNRNDVKEYLKLADIYLDAFPHSGSHSIIDALEVGLPVVTCEGNNLRSRHGAAILRDVLLDDLVTHDESSYIQCAIKLATDLEFRGTISQRIQLAMSSTPRFLDTLDYAKQLEDVFCQAVESYPSRILSQSLSLNQFNVIVFPDWSCSENELGEDLYHVIRILAQHSDRHRVTLLVASDGISAEDTEIFLSSVVMEVLMTEKDCDVADLQVSVVDNLDDNEWNRLAELLSVRISLVQESQLSHAPHLINIPRLEICELAETSFNYL